MGRGVEQLRAWSRGFLAFHQTPFPQSWPCWPDSLHDGANSCFLLCLCTAPPVCLTAAPPQPQLLLFPRLIAGSRVTNDYLWHGLMRFVTKEHLAAKLTLECFSVYALSLNSYFPSASSGTQHQACPSSRQGDVVSQSHISSEEWGRPALRPNHPGELLWHHTTGKSLFAVLLKLVSTCNVCVTPGPPPICRPPSEEMASRRVCHRSLAARQRPRHRLKGGTALCGQRHWTSVRRELSPPKRSSDKR